MSGANSHYAVVFREGWKVVVMGEQLPAYLDLWQHSLSGSHSDGQLHAAAVY